MRVFENDFVGEAGKAHGRGFAAPGAELFNLLELDNGGTGDSSANKLRDSVADVEILFAAAFETKKREAIVIGKAGLARLGDLAHFHVGDVHAAERLNRGEAHAGLVKHAGVERLKVLAGRESKRCAERERENEHARTPQKTGAAQGKRKSGHDRTILA